MVKIYQKQKEDIIMKRKWLAALLTLTMTAGLLSGCGGGGSNTGSTAGTDAPAAEADSQEESGGVIRKRLTQRVKRQVIQQT